MTSEPGAVATAAGLDLGYGRAVVARGVAFELRAGEILAVLGHNGSGKSTFVKTLLGVQAPVSGRIDWPAGRPSEIAYLGQLTEFDRKFPIRVRDLAAIGAWRGLGFRGAIDARKRALIAEALEATGVAPLADRPLHQLSSGQLQRALFARAMVQNAPLILLDEPFAAVDQTTEEAMLRLIRRWAASGRAVVLVLHDLSAALAACDRALLLGDGRARFGAPEVVLTPDSLVDQKYFSPAQADWLARNARSAEGRQDAGGARG